MYFGKKFCWEFFTFFWIYRYNVMIIIAFEVKEKLVFSKIWLLLCGLYVSVAVFCEKM